MISLTLGAAGGMYALDPLFLQVASPILVANVAYSSFRFGCARARYAVHGVGPAMANDDALHKRLEYANMEYLRARRLAFIDKIQPYMSGSAAVLNALSALEGRNVAANSVMAGTNAYLCQQGFERHEEYEQAAAVFNQLRQWLADEIECTQINGGAASLPVPSSRQSRQPQSPDAAACLRQMLQRHCALPLAIPPQRTLPPQLPRLASHNAASCHPSSPTA